MRARPFVGESLLSQEVKNTREKESRRINGVFKSFIKQICSSSARIMPGLLGKGRMEELGIGN
jgi:hypothetical protein